MISNCHINCIGIDSDNKMQSVVNELDNFLMNVRDWYICFYIHVFISAPRTPFFHKPLIFSVCENFWIILAYHNKTVHSA